MRSTRRAPSTTLAPSAERRRAVASPNPLLAPVITTTFPLMFCIFESFFVSNLEVTLPEPRAAVARGLAPPVVGLLESAMSQKPPHGHINAAGGNRLGIVLFLAGIVARNGSDWRSPRRVRFPPRFTTTNPQHFPAHIACEGLGRGCFRYWHENFVNSLTFFTIKLRWRQPLCAPVRQQSVGR